MSLVEFKHVYKSFDKKDILKDINFTIPKGRIIGLLGKNGMGKTTIIKLINDLLLKLRRRGEGGYGKKAK